MMCRIVPEVRYDVAEVEGGERGGGGCYPNKSRVKLRIMQRKRKEVGNKHV